MNKSMRQLFIAVLVLFLIITCSTFFWSIIYAPALDANPENTAAFYHEVGMARGEILSSGGQILALSQKSNDSFNYQRSYPQGEAFAPVTAPELFFLLFLTLLSFLLFRLSPPPVFLRRSLRISRW